MNPIHTTAIGALALLFFVYKKWSTTNLRLPPGPRKLPLIGNLLDMPSSQAWITHAKWAKQYKSDIIHLSAAGNSIVVLNSLEAVTDLLEKRSSIYSSRMQLTMLHDLMGWKYSFSFGPYDALWRAQRKIFTQAVNPADSERFHPKLTHSTHELLRGLMHSTDFIKDLHHWAAITIMDITYGIRGAEADPYIDTAIEALSSIATAAAPGAFVVDFIPYLKYLPEWVPGTGFKKQARKWNALRYDMTEKPFNAAKQKIDMGNYTTSLVSLALEKLDTKGDLAEQENMIKGAAVTSYGGGSDTVVAAMTAFVLAVLKHPEIQEKAHRELDKALGKGNLPSFADEPTLPYISALVKEVLRHNPITPFAIPHMLTEDDTYKGYWLPKDSVVMGNAWAILHNEEIYPNPSVFNPDRFLDSKGNLNPEIMDPTTVSFGFGRRICPGRHVAISSIWLAVASILASYNIIKDHDENGVVIEPSGEWVSGPTLFNHPLPFKCRFIVRSEAAELSIRASAD